MTEIPEHLRKRAEAARAKAEADSAPAEAADTAADAPQSEAASKIPAHLLERSKAAKSKAAGGEVEAADAAGLPRPSKRFRGGVRHADDELVEGRSGEGQREPRCGADALLRVLGEGEIAQGELPQSRRAQ